MHSSFSETTGKRHVFLLYGLGGAGKTQIAYKFVAESQARENQRYIVFHLGMPRCVWYSYCPLRFSEIFFINASTEATTAASFKSIALSKGIGSTEDDTLKWLQAQKSEWLLLFNNADDETFELHKFFPSCRHGNILITSRRAEFRDYAPGASREVSNMDVSDAQNLLLYDIQEDGPEVGKTAAEIVSVCSIMVAR